MLKVLMANLPSLTKNFTLTHVFVPYKIKVASYKVITKIKHHYKNYKYQHRDYLGSLPYQNSK